ncbi:hypothetical protein [Pseudobacteriovorax antillogorgiicola]|uniref:Cytochrome c domain-containing protein n=1 Tax=Pseudobacteriovorax antillogorgiicola TaxID=1513793 RepID=A0A1Y6CDI1_9BACT|nr:hypothetical protein [Pseudobacteriovorax antillogorgiicola]TCS47958.1 hypothetical protein EDD56_11969 [Pseudobacteriovorax antillogorgiicola]SMF58166.1 hypothetical protein SAMN06296036_11970 [Pseudobacteriovorax antillogorgiicola]
MKNFSASLGLLLMAYWSQPAMSQIHEKDLSVILSHPNIDSVSISSSLHNGAQLFPFQWYQQVLQSFARSGIGRAVEQENRFDHWQLVAMRVDPCNPLGNSPHDSSQILCWPQVRLVWQPIVRNLNVGGRFFQSYADDRAIHGIYDLNPALDLGSEEAAYLQGLRNRVVQFFAQNNGLNPLHPLTFEEEEDFIRLRNRMVSSLVARVINLRDQRFSSQNYRGHGLRPEVSNFEMGNQFRSRLLSFLTSYAQPSNLSALTAFSLPAGRSPARINVWDFLSFSARNGAIFPANVVIRSLHDGRPIFNLGHISNARVQVDDQRLERARLPSNDFNDLFDSVMIHGRRHAAQNIINANRVLTKNTSCGSCHRINQPGFNFHNLSRLEGTAVNVSSRVINDVRINLAWLSQQNLNISN